MYQIYLLSLLLISFLAPFDAISNPPFNGDEKATISFDLDECYSRIPGQSRFDFTEFTASTVNSSFAEVSVIGDNLYRNNPQQNGHSCTPGIGGSPAMCVTSRSSCDYQPVTDKAIIIDIAVEPLGDAPVTLSKFSFYELAPQRFSYIDGASGVNDYPTLYGIRVLKDGIEVYKDEAIATTTAWSLEEFDFSSLESFTITEPSEFTFMLLGYCSVGNAANVNVWDVEQIEIEVTQTSIVSGGVVSGGPYEFCIDGQIDNISDISVSGNSGANSQWVVTDPDGNILGLPPTLEAVNFDGAGAGVCLIWHLSYENGLTGLMSGSNISNLIGCYDISNSIQVTRTSVNGGEIIGGPFQFVVDGQSDYVSGVFVEGNIGANSQWIVTDSNGNILGLPPTPEAVDFDGAGIGVCFIWHLSYSDGLQGLSANNNVSDLSGCFDLSNSIRVERVSMNTVNGGVLSGGEEGLFRFCVDGISDMVSGITLSEAEGPNQSWIVTDPDGNILGLPPMPSVVDFDAAGEGICFIWNISYEDGLTGLTAGENVANLSGIYSLSNAIEVVRAAANGGEIFGGPFEFTVGDGVADMIPEGAITVANSNGANSQWIITDDEGNILGLPPTFTAPNFDGAGAGTCLVWYLRYDGEISGLAVGQNASDLEGCFGLSNSIEVVRTNAGDCQVNGGEIFGGPFEFTVGDGVADMIPEGAITVANSNGANSQWIITDDEGNILGLPPTFTAPNFDGAGAGTCLVWYLRYDGEISGLAVGQNASDLEGCFGLSNSIEVVRTNAGDCQANGGEIFGGPFEFTVGDGVADMIPEGAITVANSNGANSQWIITDDEGNILGLPPTFTAPNFDGAGAGTCLVWYLRYDGEISGLAVGQNASDLEGCFGLSNSIEVVRTNAGDCQANGGEIFGGPFEFTVGDGVADMIPEGAITVANSNGANSQWIITDDEGNILGLPPTFTAPNFDGAGAGTCLVWYLRYDGEISGLAVGQNASDLEGCFGLSNSIEVVRTNAGDCQANGGEIFGGPFEFTVGDGVADMIPEGAITVANSNGANSQWIITDDEGNILGLPPTFTAPNFDGAGAGTCLVWYLRYDGEISGLAVGQNASDLEGCFGLSNSIEVVRTNAGDCQANGGEIFGGPFEFTVGDGVADMIPEGAITVANSNGANSQWIITDDEGNILGLPPTFTAPNFDGAGAGTCLVWYLRYDGEISGLAVGQNASDLEGCFGLSNSIEVIRMNAGDCQANGGEIFGGPFEFTVGDGVADMIPEGAITVANSNGANSQWIITDDEGNILGLPPTFTAPNFDGAGAGTCLVWYLRYDGEISGLAVGQNASDLEGCFGLSNSIEVIRTNAGDCQANGGEIFGGPFEFTVGDGEADMIPEGAITVVNSNGANSQWIITDDEGNILGLPPTFTAPNFDGAGAGTCLVWYLRYDGEISGLAVGQNASDLEGCFGLSNSIEVVRTNAGDCQANGGEIFGGPFEFTVGDGVADMIPEGAITVANSNGANSQWIITDDEGNILGLPPTFTAPNFDGAGAGTCLVWYLRYDGEISGLAVGQNASDLEGCFGLSNSIEVIRMNAGDCQANGGEIFGGPFEFTVGDGVADMIPEGAITVANSNGANSQWIITDDEGNILGLPPTFTAPNFDGAGAGTCLVWYLRYDGEISGLAVGQNASDLEGCFGLSNSIEVVRTNAGDCQANGGEIFGGPFEFTVGDGEADMIPEGAITVVNSNGANSQWIITDDEGNILGLPPTFTAPNFDGAGAGTCLVWYLRYDGEISGLAVGQNASDLEGCFGLSNSIEVVRTNAGDCQANGGEIFGGPFEFTVGDGVADMIPEGAITVANSNGANSQWIITDDEGNILGLPPTFTAPNFDGAGAGTCLVWYLRYDGEISGLAVGQNASDLEGCFGLSNSIEVIRTLSDDCQVIGGEISGGPFDFCVDGDADFVSGVEINGNSGLNSQWIITDADGNILGLPPTPEAVDFDEAGAGVCFIWHISYEDGLEGLEANENVSELMGCYALSNSVQVTRSEDGSACSQGVGIPIINEVLGSGMVEIRNIGDGSIDISDYWLCDRPEYDRIGNLQINCGGDFILEPGELVTVILNSITVNGADGEMGLYINSSFGSATAIVDYVEWGSSGHGRSSVAVSANIWTTGDAAETFANDESLVYDGTGDTQTDWSATSPSPCDQNGFGGFIEDWNLISNPVSDNARLSVNSLTDQNKVTIEIRSLQGDLIRQYSQAAFKGENVISMNISDLRSGLYLVVMRSPSIKRIEKLVKQ